MNKTIGIVDNIYLLLKFQNSLLLDGPIETASNRFVVKLADFGLAKTQELS